MVLQVLVRWRWERRRHCLPLFSGCLKTARLEHPKLVGQGGRPSWEAAGGEASDGRGGRGERVRVPHGSRGPLSLWGAIA